MARLLRIAVLGALAVMVIPSVVAAQSSVRQLGRAADANPRVGSGGLNSPSDAGGRFDSQLYVTGQVSGLARFRGAIGYSAPDELNLSLPSASLSSFRRQSVGLSESQAGITYSPTPYYDRTSTAWRAGGLISRGGQAGLRLSGAVIPAPSARPLYVDTRLTARPTIASAGSRVLADASATPGIEQVDTSEIAAYLQALRMDTLARPGAQSFFGVLKPSRQSELVQELAFSAGKLALDTRLRNQIDRSIDADIRVPLAARKPAEDAEPIVPEPREPDEPADLTSDGLGADQDVFMDMLSRLQEKRIAEITQRLAEEGGPIERPKRWRPNPPGREPGSSQPGRTGSRRRLVELAPSRGLVVHSLAGRHKDMFNITMRRAEADLKAGRYYQAAGNYELAITFNVRNPLARFGLGLALFGGGEPLAAAVGFRQAIELLPDIMEAEVDVAAMMDAETFSRRLEHLEERLRQQDERPEPSLLFVVALMHHVTGNAEKAGLYARRLEAAAAEDLMMQSCAKFILDATGPATTQPAGES